LIANCAAEDFDFDASVLSYMPRPILNASEELRSVYNYRVFVIS
jgi:hypothetical protein